MELVRNNWENAFEDVKKLLFSGLSLVHFDPRIDMVVTSDTSEYEIEVLLNKYKDGYMVVWIH